MVRKVNQLFFLSIINSEGKIHRKPFCPAWQWMMPKDLKLLIQNKILNAIFMPCMQSIALQL